MSNTKSRILSFLEEKVINPIMDIVKSDNNAKIQEYADTIIRNSKGEILLLQRSFNDDFMPGVWCLPGGKVEENDSDNTEAAKREVQEETGLEIVPEFIETIEKEKAIIHYFQCQVNDDNALLLLDNEEHFRYEFVSFDKLNRYDLIFDLGDILEDLKEKLNPVLTFAPQRELTPEEETLDIKKAFDEGMISDDHFIAYSFIQDSIGTILKAFEQGKITPEEYSNAIEKSKRHEFVKVVRDGKTFYQFREVGSDKIEEELPLGDHFDADGLGLTITKYSDKSFLITGDTYKNLDLLRKIKADVGLGSWNKTLNGWVYPANGKEKIFAALISKMPDDSFDETKDKEDATNLKNSLEVGSSIIVGGEECTVNNVSTNEEGAVTYDTTVGENKVTVTETEVGIPAADETKAEELINNVTEENRIRTGKELFGKEEGEAPVSNDTDNENKDVVEIREFVTRSGENIKALDFSNVKPTDIQLISQDTILDKQRPYYIPEINEYMFSGSRDNRFIFDYVKMSDGNFLVSLNGYKDNYITNNSSRYKKVDPAYAVMSLDNLVALTEYYKSKRKSELKKEADDYNSEIPEKIRNLTPQQVEHYKPFAYSRLSAKQQKQYSNEQWEALSYEEKLKETEFMTSPVYKKKSVVRIKPLEDDMMMKSNFDMYKQYVDKSYKTPFDNGLRTYRETDPCVIEYSEAREQIKWKRNDLELQREENDGSYKKGLETSWGDSNTKDDLYKSHGVKIKSQNGKELSIDQIEQIKDNLSKVYESFGDRSEMSKSFGLKISHAGEKRMFASKFLGIYYPSMKAIGVSNDPEMGKFGFTLAHEFAHFMDNYSGSKGSRHYSSDNFDSLAGQIASTFRKNMNSQSESKYINRSCECFARAFEQYHAMKHGGDDVVKYKIVGEPYHKDANHVSKEKFNTIIKPLIEQFLNENKTILKSAFTELQLIDINNNFEIIKGAFDNNDLEEPVFHQYAEKYNTLVKGDPSHGGKLVKKTIVDKSGKKETKWVSNTQDTGDDKNKPLEFTAHSKPILAAFAKETPEAELKRVINESHDEKLRQAAHAELDRRSKDEKTQNDEKDNLDSLIKERNKLYGKALGMFPKSPAQMKVRDQIDEINLKIKKLEKDTK